MSEEKIKITAQENDVGKRLDAFASEKSSFTRARIQKMLEDGCVLLNSKTPPKSYKIKPGDTVELICAEPVSAEAQPEDIPIDIVYEDNDVAVINKPKGLVVHPAAGNESGTLVNALLFRLKESLSGIGGVIRPGIVHRIDKDTSGLLIVAKNDDAHLSLAAQIKEHSARRVYYAIALGNIKENLTVDAPIGRHPVDRKKMAVTNKNSKPAVTHVEVIEHFTGCTLVRCILETGRTHQIRVHLSSIGHPILGDEVYGGVKNQVMQKYGKSLSGQCLHAGEITFTHPKTNEQINLSAPLPDYFEKILSSLRGSI